MNKVIALHNTIITVFLQMCPRVSLPAVFIIDDALSTISNKNRGFFMHLLWMWTAQRYDWYS